MSYKSREKKRMYKAATSRGQQHQRENHADRHYLTIVRRPCCCNTPSCARSMRPGAECVYRYAPREILCVECANRRKIRYRPSLTWERARSKKRGKSKPGAPTRGNADREFGAGLLDRIRDL